MPRTIVFGKASDDSSSSDDSKEIPLVASNYHARNSLVMPRGNRYSPKNMKSSSPKVPNVADDDSSTGSMLCSCIGHLMVLFLPLIAMIFMLAFLSLLVEYDRQELQGFELYGYENVTTVAGMYYTSVSSDTISVVMSQYDPYAHVLALASCSCVFVTMVTVARNIQIEQYQKQAGSYVFMKFINYFSSIINILAYVGLMVAVNFKITQESPAWAPRAHFIGFCSFFAGTAVYAFLHQILLWNQADYPTGVKSLFFVLNVTTFASSAAFGLPIWFSELSSDEGAEPILEWIAVFSSAITIGFYVILFFIDPADENIMSFFCCPKRSNKDRESRHKMRKARQPLQPVPLQPTQPQPLAYNMQPLDTEVYDI